MSQNEIIVTTISNPFSGDKDVKQVPCTGEPVFHYLPVTDEEITIIHNGHMIPQEQFSQLCPQPGDSIVIRPVISGGGGGGNEGGKSLLKTVAFVALSVFTMGVGSAITAGFWGASVAASSWSFGAWLTAASIGFIGSKLINQLLPTPGMKKEDPTYSWGGLQAMQGQGNPVPITYGSVRTAGQIISQHITTDPNDGKSYLNVLLSGGEGEVEISDVQINGTPVGNFPGVSCITCMGTNDQEIIPGFGDTYADQFFSQELTGDPYTQTTEGDGGTGLEITIDFPNGLWHYTNGYSNSESTTVKIKAQYCIEDGEPNKKWVDWSEWTINEKHESSFRKTYRIDGLAPGRYSVKVWCSYKAGTDSYYNIKPYWTCLSHIVEDNFCRPGRALLGIQALATDKLSGGMPQITWVQTRKYVWVWDPNPEVNQYVQQDADNPAWACYDLLHRCKQLKDIHTGEYIYTPKGVDVSRIDYQAFKNWADYCNDIVAVVDGEPEKRCRVDIILDTAQSLWDALCPIEAVGRGKVIIKGTQYSCICDKPSDPVQLFNVSNIGIDSFNETFMGSKDRANALEVTFTNKDKDYQRDIVFVAADGYDNSEIMQKPVQVTLNGITRYRQAYREAKYRLSLNKYLTRTVSFSADIDAIACTVGDVILVQHDVPQWGIGGRVVAATANTVTLDKPVTLEANKTYQIMIRLSTTDELVTRTVSGVSEDGKTLTIADVFAAIPQQGDLFSFGEVDKVAKPFRVMNITRDGDLRRKITALEYVDAVYTEATDIPVIDYNRERADFIEVTDLSAQEETFRQKDGTMVSQIRCKWYLPRRRADGFVVYYSSDDGKTWTYCTTATIPEAIIPNVRTGETYLVKVCTMRSPVVSLGEISAPVYISGKDQPPSDVPKLSLIQMGENIKAVIVEPDDPDINCYELRMGSSWDNSIRIKYFTGDNTTFEAPMNGSLVFWVKAIDNSRNPSANATKYAINVSGLKPKNIIYDSTEHISMDISKWQATGMYRDYWGYLRMQSKERVDDYQTFDQVLAVIPHMVDAPTVDLPKIDLGEGVIEAECYYIDFWGEVHLKSIERVDDYVTFDEVLAVNPLHLVEPRAAMQTLMGVDIDWNSNHVVRLDTEYRVRVDGDGWSNWTIYSERQFFGRRVQIRLLPKSLDGVSGVIIRGGKVNIDVPDIEDIIENVPIEAVKTKIHFHRKFYTIPKSIEAYTRDLAGKLTANRIDPNTITNADCDLEILGDNDNPIAGKLELMRIRGY